MWIRTAWQQRIEAGWSNRSVLWLMGVRRTGKTMLCQSLPDIEYFDLELPSVRRRLSDPEAFLSGFQAGSRIALDEIHRLDNPAELLKIAADHFPKLRVLATGSSTLGASARFRDTLAGRKQEIWLTPMTLADVAAARGTLLQRLANGGLPPLFGGAPQQAFQEWLDAFWAKDVLELFRLERRRSFQKLLELAFLQSGGMFEASSFAGPCEVSRTTVANYLAVAEASFVVHVVRPFHSNPAREIVGAPRVYAFDTGFVRVFRGWHELRPEDEGSLFEHLVLNELHAAMQQRAVMYWRTKRGEKVDFVVAAPGAAPVAIECKRRANDFEPRGLRAFRAEYPGGSNYVVTMDTKEPYEIRHGDLLVRYCDLATLVSEVVPTARPVARRRGKAGRRRPGK